MCVKEDHDLDENEQSECCPSRVGLSAQRCCGDRAVGGGGAISASAVSFLLDNKLPFGANVLCLGASGEDGMPVVLSHTVNPDSLQAEDTSVVRQSGATSTPMCATLRPTGDVDEITRFC